MLSELLRAPLIVAIFGAAILHLPDQTTELYRVMALDYKAGVFRYGEASRPVLQLPSPFQHSAGRS